MYNSENKDMCNCGWKDDYKDMCNCGCQDDYKEQDYMSDCNYFDSHVASYQPSSAPYDDNKCKCCCRPEYRPDYKPCNCDKCCECCEHKNPSHEYFECCECVKRCCKCGCCIKWCCKREK